MNFESTSFGKLTDTALAIHKIKTYKSYLLRNKGGVIESSKQQCAKYIEIYKRIKINETFDPIEVIATYDGKYVIKDGIHRASIALALGYEKVPILIKSVDDELLKLMESLRDVYPKTGRKVLYVPIDHPVFSDWKALRDDTRWMLIKDEFDWKGKRILDIGSYTGYFSHKIAKLGGKVTGIEVDVKRLEQAKMINTLLESDVEFLHADFFKYLKEVKKLPYKKIIITGCIPQTEPKELKGSPLLGTSQVQNIVQLVEEVLHDNSVEMLNKEENERLNLPKIRKNPVIEIIPICEGCLGDPCAYCKVKEARGELRSYPKEDIVKQARRAISEGIREIWLTAQDTGAYGKDINTSLSELLKEILNIPGMFKIRVGMMNPNHVLEDLDNLIEIFKSEKIYKFLHIPVQSGNNEILKSMKRKYTAEQFKEIIKRFREAIPNITIATDIIVGFPGETEEQYNNTLDLIKEITPDVLNRSKFWPRKGTKAAKMEDKVKGDEVKRRSSLISHVFKNISRMRNERWLGWQGEILINEKGKENTLIGRNEFYKPVLVKGDYKLGQRLKVKIVRTDVHNLRAF